MLRVARFLILAAVLLGGCAKEEEPYAESIPEIPPGRANMSSDNGGGGGYQPPAPPAHK